MKLVKFAKHYPHQLSGGMKQRVAIARALVGNPEFILMDEPFAALDFQTRVLMQQFLLEVWAGFKSTILFVTHQIDEAVLLADRVVVMSAAPGTVLEEIEDRPAAAAQHDRPGLQRLPRAPHRAHGARGDACG